MIDSLFLVNLYEGCVQASFEDTDHLITYLKEKQKAGSLMGEGAFTVFLGRHLSTSQFWEEAFGKEKQGGKDTN